MPKQNEAPNGVCEESIADLKVLARHIAGRVQYILDGEEVPPLTQRAIAVIIDGERARAYVDGVSCGDGNTIVCRATAIPERNSHNSIRHEINIIFRHDRWSITTKRSWSIVDEEDLSNLIEI